MKVIVIPAKEPARFEDADVTLEWLQRTCADGGQEFVETIAAAGAVLWFSEDSKAMGRPANPSATEALRHAGGFPGDYIAGTVVVTGPAKRGEATEVPESWHRIVPEGGTRHG